MLVLGKKTDYALISLVWLTDRADQFVSAREIAEENGLPLPALMQILKLLHQNGVLRSTRGVKGGYQINVSLESLSLLSLSQMLSAADVESDDRVSQPTDDQFPLKAMRQKLSRFLQDISVADVIRPRRIDVPVKNVRILERVTV